jgi:hypothetical protein
MDARLTITDANHLVADLVAAGPAAWRSVVSRHEDAVIQDEERADLEPVAAAA